MQVIHNPCLNNDVQPGDTVIILNHFIPKQIRIEAPNGDIGECCYVRSIVEVQGKRGNNKGDIKLRFAVCDYRDYVLFADVTLFNCQPNDPLSVKTFGPKKISESNKDLITYVKQVLVTVHMTSYVCGVIRPKVSEITEVTA